MKNSLPKLSNYTNAIIYNSKGTLLPEYNTETNMLKFDDALKSEQRSVVFNVFYAIVLASGGYFFSFYEEIFENLKQDNPYIVYDKLDIKIYDKIQEFNQFTTIIFCLGNILGLIVSGILINKIGRLKTIIYNEIFIIFILSGYLIKNVITVKCTHFCAGIASGI